VSTLLTYAYYTKLRHTYTYNEQNWDMIDMSYLNINDSHGVGELRRSWDGLPVNPSPKLDQISVNTVAKIKELTAMLDQPLYIMAVEKFNKQVSAFVYIYI
jgi:hypothetical protein